MFSNEPITREKLQRFQTIAWFLTFGIPAFSTSLALFIWIRTPPHQITSFELIVIYVVLPLIGLAAAVIGTFSVKDTRRRLRQRDYQDKAEQDTID